MKVLHLPYNVASQASVSVQGLRAIGVNARGLVVRGPDDAVQSHDAVEILPDPPPLPRSIRWARQHASRYAKVMAAIAWADVLHWHYGALVLRGGFDLRWARFLGKPGIAEFWGTDIRIAEIEAADNPYFALHMPPEYCSRQTLQRSVETQSRFAAAGFSCMVSDAAMLSYVRQDLFPRVHMVRQRLLLSAYTPSPPDPHRKRLCIVHSPSNPKLKGSEFVQAAVKKLQSTYDFEFRLVHGLSRAEALGVLREADIFVDQLILGGHGLAALEAMGMAKPVVCYIKPSLLSKYPQDLPVVNANPDNIIEVLEGLLSNGSRRHELGVQGRAYVERHHDAVKLAGQLRDIYQATSRSRFSSRTASRPPGSPQQDAELAPKQQPESNQDQRKER